MREVKVKASKEYSVLITSGFTNLQLQLEIHKVKNIFLITDENVYGLHRDYFDKLKDKITGIYIIKPGEESKNYETINKIYGEMIKNEVNRRTTVAAVGGGVVGDLAGFAASTFMRGLRLIQIPTTLLAQCDSSIGGKNGYNLKNIKNVIGTIYQPAMVYIDVNFLKTLSEREYKNGLAEVIKYGFVCDKNFFNYIEENKRGIGEREVDKLLHIVTECAKIKGSIIEIDENDNDARQVLNFGHTIGHALESVSGFSLSHGEAVSIGMNIEAYLSLKLDFIDQQSYRRLISLLNYFKLPLMYDNIEPELVVEYIRKDKKKISNEIKFALPDKIGHAIITTELKQNYIYEAICEMIGRRI